MMCSSLKMPRELKIPRELIPRHPSSTTRNPQRNLLLSYHRGRRVFGITSLLPLACSPDLIPISVDPISQPPCATDDLQSRAMQIHADSVKICPRVVDRGP